MSQIGVGVVGCGFVGRGAHVPAFAKIDGSRLVAVADMDPSRSAGLHEKYQAKTYTDFARLMDDPDVNAVVISVPTPLHAQVALAAIESGRHVLCEMPLATTSSEAQQLIATAKQHHVVLMPSLTFRFTPTFVKVKQLLQQGVLGEPVAAIYRELIPASDLARQWPPGSWMWDLARSGGPLFTLAVWSIDLMRWLFESEIRVSGSAVRYTPLEQFGGTLGYDCTASLQLESGVVGCLQYSGTSNSSGASNTLEVIGSSGAVIRVNANETVTLCSDDPAKTEWHVKQPGTRMWGHFQQDEHFVRALLEDRPPSVTAEDGIAAMEVARQLCESGQS